MHKFIFLKDYGNLPLAIQAIFKQLTDIYLDNPEKGRAYREVKLRTSVLSYILEYSEDFF